MVAGFRRSTSFHVPNPDPKPTSCHLRSSSLPSRSHPLVSHLHDEINSLRAWHPSQPSSTAAANAAWLNAGLAHLDLVHVALDNLLHLPQTQESLRQHRPASDTLLNDYLRFADAYGCFRECLLSLRHLQSSAEVAVRRRDMVTLTSQAKARKKVEKEVVKLVSLLRNVGKEAAAVPEEEEEVVGVIREVRGVVVSVSVTVLLGLVAFLTTSFSTPSSSSSAWKVLRKRVVAAAAEEEEEWRRWKEGLKGMEECLVGLERGSERVFRCFLNTRVSLLNTFTP